MMTELTEHGTLRLYPENGAEAHQLRRIADHQVELHVGSASYSGGPTVWLRLDWVDLALVERKPALDKEDGEQ